MIGRAKASKLKCFSSIEVSITEKRISNDIRKRNSHDQISGNSVGNCVNGGWLLSGLGLGGAPPKDLTVEQAYSGLATGILKSAKLVRLNKGVLLTAEGTKIEESVLKEIIKNSKPEMHEQLKKNLFFILEQIATKKLLLYEAYKSGHRKKGPEDQVIMTYLNEKVSGVTVSEEESKRFYDQNKETMGGMPFEQAKDAIHDYLLQHKKQNRQDLHANTRPKNRYPSRCQMGQKAERPGQGQPGGSGTRIRETHHGGIWGHGLHTLRYDAAHTNQS